MSQTELATSATKMYIIIDFNMNSIIFYKFDLNSLYFTYTAYIHFASLFLMYLTIVLLFLFLYLLINFRRIILKILKLKNMSNNSFKSPKKEIPLSNKHVLNSKNACQFWIYIL